MNLLTLHDMEKSVIDGLIERASALKGRHRRRIPHQPLAGKVLGLIFEKPSTRTRVSFQTAMYHLGGNAIFISHRDSQIGRGEPIKDTARVLSGYVDGVVIRTFGHEIIEEYSRYSTIPVINGLTDLHHPCQVLADIMTVVEKKGRYENLRVAWIGDGNNMANSWIEAASRLGFELSLACPEGYYPDSGIVEKAREEGKASIKVTEDPGEAVADADVVNTDVWASMGQEEEQSGRSEVFQGYQVNAALMARAKSDALVMHCLPAHRGEEITEEVLEGENSVVWEQAENRLHMQKAILEWLL